MKGIRKENASRREFIKKAAQVAAASTLVGCAGPKEKSGQPGKRRLSVGKKPKPGDHGHHPPGSKFKGDLKLPGWLPDTTVVDDEYLFLEEEILTAPKLSAFPPPNRFPINPNAVGDAFKEPLPTAPADKWNDFKSWILGAPLNVKIDPATNQPVPFDGLLSDIADCIRRYNAALYWMRRLHFHEKAKLLNLAISSPPPRNEHGDDDPNDDLMNWTLDDIQKKIPASQEGWTTAVTKINNILSGTNGPFEYIWADLVQVNNYIVSMRIVASNVPPTLRSGAKIYEVGGSSSSHTSISSAFSSP